MFTKERNFNYSQQIYLKLFLFLFMLVISLIVGVNKSQAIMWIDSPQNREDTSFDYIPSTTENTSIEVYGSSIKNSVWELPQLNGLGQTNPINFVGYYPRENMEIIWRRITPYNGQSLDMHIRLNNIRNCAQVSVPQRPDRIGFFLDQKYLVNTKFDGYLGGGYPAGMPPGLINVEASATATVWFTKTGTNNPPDWPTGLETLIALGFGDLEPQWFRGNSGGMTRVSLDQRVSIWGSNEWNWRFASPWDNPSKTLINKDYITNPGIHQFTTRNGITMPDNRTVKPGGNIVSYNVNDVDTSGYLVYSPRLPNGKVQFRFSGHAGDGDYIGINNANITQSPTQPKPRKEVSLSARENWRTEVTPTTVNHRFYYKITQEIKRDSNVNGTGFVIEDHIPTEAKVLSVQMSHGGMWSASTNGNYVKFTAKQNVFNAPGQYTFYVECIMNVPALKGQLFFDNKAKAIPPRGSKGGGETNKVRVNVPRRKITINYLDFDHNERHLIPSTVIKDIPVGIPHEFTPPSSITYKNKLYKYVHGKNDGRETTPTKVINNTQTDYTYNFYYRTKWTYYEIHQKDKTNPPYTQAENPDGNLIKKVKHEVYYKTDDGKRINTITIVPILTLKTRANKQWFPLEVRKTEQKQESDTQVIRLNYDTVIAGGKIDFIRLDTMKAERKEFPMQYQWQFTGLKKEPFISTNGLSGLQLTDANNINRLYSAALDDLKYTITVNNKTSGTNNVFLKNGRYRDAQNNIIKDLNAKIKDNRVEKDKNYNILYNIQYTSTKGLILNPPKDANTHINTASEKIFKNADLRNGKIDYTQTVRTLFVGSTNRVLDFKETLKLNFTDKVSQKTGYYDVSDMNIDYQNDIETKTKLQTEDYTVKLPKEFFEDYKAKNDAAIIKSKDLLVMALNNEKERTVNSRVAIPDINGLTKWNGVKYDIVGQYPIVYAETKTGNLFTERAVKVRDSEIKNDLVDGGNKFYFPLWLDIKQYDGKFDLSNKNGVRKTIGVNALSFEFNKKFDIFAQMYSDIKSGTKKKDELYVQPVFANEDYKELSNLTPAGKKWVTSPNTQNGINK